ncbi:glucan 1,3-alpha-glucosidase ROT2 [Ascoidea rubescens DSM 1968]|uniref:Glucosidase II subunit alpha n=1 Tax=Ascoidea rubescens DSM 1968 TaxID=1344418 RepID=A0A1D2VFT3_9ASCO|nr:glycoside hydrolase family 31 protein [Ascoidea rubescens DSM 1968]ODV60380.1 glycoside hydrolase family 31 protein [Ascoidea rubescens DSM 1968]
MKLNWLVLFAAFCFCVVPSLAVKEYLFKKCSQSGFCQRNRHFSNQVSKLSLNDEYQPRYSIDKSSIKFHNNNSTLVGRLNKKLNDDFTSVAFGFQLNILENHSIRFRIEDQLTNTVSNFRRYNETSYWSFKDHVQPDLFFEINTESKSENIIIGYSNGLYKIKIQLYPFKLTYYYNNSPSIVLNDRNFLNIEHFRKKNDNDLTKNLSPEELDFDCFTDSFKDSSKNTLKRGPESVALDATFKNFLNVYGIPEHADSMALKTTRDNRDDASYDGKERDLDPYRLFNVDIFEYETDSKLPNYGSIPFMLAHSHNVSAGLFWVNSADTWIDIIKKDKSTKTHWISEAGLLDIILILDNSPASINQKYGDITGYVALPQLFSLGYHQCRWNYNNQDDVLNINKKFDYFKIPMDSIWLDIEYTDEKKYFTWKNSLFNNPTEMLSILGETGRNLIAIIDPHIKSTNDKNYNIEQQILKNNLAIKDSDNKNPFHGQCWPGDSIWIDTFNPKAITIWASFYQNFTTFSNDSTNLHIWNDMNEPSVFSGPETTAPKDLVHYGDWEHRSLHNLYGHSLIEATYQGLNERYQNMKRPFILTRSYFSGSQRYSAMWSGDNMSKWGYLKISIPMALTSGISGMPFSGSDVGGFFGDPSSELLTRWYQTGIWYPFFRGHAHIDSKRREPWVPGDPYTSIIRDAIKLRYSLLPVFYNSFYESSINGLPVMKPLFYENPNNEKIFDIDDEFFIGNSGILVKPITEESLSKFEIYIPDDEIYYDFNDFTKIDQGEGKYEYKNLSLDNIPILIKGGNIIPRKMRYRRSSKLMRHDPYTLIIALDKNQTSSGILYVDDFETFNYKNNEEYLLCKLKFENNQISSNINNYKNFFDGIDEYLEIEKIIIVGLDDSGDNFKGEISQNNKIWNASIIREKNSLVIKNPKVKVNTSWKINIFNEKP